MSDKNPLDDIDMDAIWKTLNEPPKRPIIIWEDENFVHTSDGAILLKLNFDKKLDIPPLTEEEKARMAEMTAKIMALIEANKKP